VFFPDDQLPLDVLDAILAASGATCAEAGVAIVGGHSVRDAEVKFGLSVTGDVAPGEAWSNRRARPGDQLVLTKAIGTGVIGQAIKKGVAGESTIAAATRSMTTTNQAGARIGRAHGVACATDITGFGLLGHLRNITRASGVAATVELATVPLLPDAALHMRAKVCPAGSKANRAHVAADTVWAGGAVLGAEPADDSEREVLASLACDAQTSGGLLLCVARDRVAACVDDLRAAGLPAARIGELRERAANAPMIELR
jgi:selenide,water dikinase